MVWISVWPGTVLQNSHACCLDIRKACAIIKSETVGKYMYLSIYIYIYIYTLLYSIVLIAFGDYQRSFVITIQTCT